MLLITSNSAIKRVEERSYREHNITRTTFTPAGAVGVVEARPNSPENQCKCGNCKQHRKRGAITETAEPGKDR